MEILVRRQVDPNHASTTIDHLVQLWHHMTPSGHWDVKQDDHSRSRAAREVATDITQTLRILGTNLPESITRSTLYKFADLFDVASDSDAFFKELEKDRFISESDKEVLMSGRNRIVERPWL